jgi:hypothetical protein
MSTTYYKSHILPEVYAKTKADLNRRNYRDVSDGEFEDYLDRLRQGYEKIYGYLSIDDFVSIVEFRHRLGDDE